MSGFDFGDIGFSEKKSKKKDMDMFGFDDMDLLGGGDEPEVLSHGKKKFVRRGNKLVRLTKRTASRNDGFEIGNIGYSSNSKDQFDLFGGGMKIGMGDTVKRAQGAADSFNKGREKGSGGLFKRKPKEKKELVGVSEAVGIGVGKLQKKLHERKMRKMDEERDQRKRRFVSEKAGLGQGHGETV